MEAAGPSSSWGWLVRGFLVLVSLWPQTPILPGHSGLIYEHQRCPDVQSSVTKLRGTLRDRMDFA